VTSNIDEQPKKLADITEADIIEAVRIFAVQYGWQIEPRDCHVVPIRKTLHADEIGLGHTQTQLEISSWWIHVTPRVPPNKFTAQLKVRVQYYSGGVAADEFQGPEHLDV
jgi:hypothetical protein